MWDTILDRMLARLVSHGRLRVIYPDGTARQYGAGPDPATTLTIRQPRTVRALCLSPDLALGEGYVDGTIAIDQADLHDALALLVRNRTHGGLPAWAGAGARWRSRLAGWATRNTPARARRNVAHHYDLSDDFYRLFLDADMQYSCAYFTDPGMPLDQAQEAKKHHIAGKLLLRPGMRVLDIGCGWGGMALTLARDYGVQVTGITLSRNQRDTAQARVTAAGLDGRVTIRMADYRTISGHFDRIVSVGMLEHVGPAHYRTFFRRLRALLAEDGVALVHTIGFSEPPHPTSDWILRNIFPGGHIPSMSQLSPAYERAQLWLTDVEVLRGHYALTCQHWRARFEAALPEVRRMYDDRFVRMWRYYLVACQAAFEEQWQGVFQLQLARRQDAVPATRDYLYGADRNAYLHAAQ
ncbi:MAG: class I SAM-dependent methyltransferase [Roseivivax sp.]|nr:class I SAM-dependent methyltransferase [Roseivivax sp.]